jgi:type II secretory pathway pseudopilin PulG
MFMQETLVSANEKPGVQARSRSHYQALTAVFAIVAIIASAAALYVWRGQRSTVVQLALAQSQARHAEETLKASETAIDTLVANLADRLASAKAIPNQELPPLLAQIETAVGTLVTKTDNDQEARRIQAAMYITFSSTYLARGNAALAVASAKTGSNIFRALAAAEPNNDEIQSNVGLSLQRLGEALRASGDIKGGLTADRESLEIARALGSKEPGNRQFRTDVVLALWRLASAGDEPRTRLTEALKILNNLKLAAMLTPAQEEWITAIEDDLSRMP